MSFKKTQSIGNRLLDAEHKKLHDIIGEISRLIVAGNTTVLPNAFERLENYLHSYFAVEENIAHAIGFDFVRHRLAHQNLLALFQHTKREMLARNGVFSGHEKNLYAIRLGNYLTQHITVDSRPLKIVLDTHYYDFNPNTFTRNEYATG